MRTQRFYLSQTPFYQQCPTLSQTNSDLIGHPVPLYKSQRSSHKVPSQAKAHALIQPNQPNLQPSPMASRWRTKTSGGARKSGGGGVRAAGQARPSLGPAGEGLDPADRRDKLEVFLQDFDREVLARKQQIQTLTNSVLEGLNMCYSLRITLLPPRVRAMTLQEFKATSLGNEQLEPPLEELLEADLVLDKAMRLRGKRVGGVKLAKKVAVQGSSGGATAEEETEKLAAQEGCSLRKRGSSRKLPADKVKASLVTNPKKESSQKMYSGYSTGKFKSGLHSKSASSLGVHTPPVFDPRLARTPHMYRTRAGSKLLRDSIRLSGTTVDNGEGKTGMSQDKLSVLCQKPGSSQS
ncbi:uncharacterized protein LOC116944219 isoform X2 [Petromyzon marinus]|uniref:uncharacterized protein LOC116944219 isoform X2 n=1 Tax=Petromyzon marinus TaxID=7757 RepID=UPI003F713842